MLSITCCTSSQAMAFIRTRRHLLLATGFQKGAVEDEDRLKSSMQTSVQFAVPVYWIRVQDTTFACSLDSVLLSGS